jgi:hypothetical protein
MTTSGQHRYDRTDAASRRLKNLDGLNQDEFPGTCLGSALGTSKEGCALNPANTK